MYRHAPILTFAVNQSHIDTVAMRLLQRLTGTTYHMFRRVYVLDIYQMLTLSSQNHRMALNSFTQCYIHNSNISNDTFNSVWFGASWVFDQCEIRETTGCPHRNRRVQTVMLRCTLYLYYGYVVFHTLIYQRNYIWLIDYLATFQFVLIQIAYLITLCGVILEYSLFCLDLW